MNFKTINPATEEVIKTYRTISEQSALNIAKQANSAQKKWRDLKIKDRAHYMKSLSKTLLKNKKHYAKLITTEMGKPISQSIAEIEKCSWLAEYFAENSQNFLKEEPVKTEANKSFVRFDPLGTVLCIMPWNFPFWQALRFAVPALMAGNTALLRHSNVVPECALAIEQSFKQAGFPKNIFRTVITDYDCVNSLIPSPYIQGVSLTGSTQAGSKVAQIAMQALKKCVLELGGSDPFIVLDDADLKLACQNATSSRLLNAGQSCISAKRFIIIKSKAKKFTELFVKYTKAQKIGNPMKKDTQVGPLVREEQLKTLESQVQDAVKKGAKILTGGNRLNRKGFFYEPTIITNTKPSMRVIKEEVFGPVAPIIIAKNEADAIRIANSSEYGLGASIWTRNRKKAEQLAQKIEAGVVFVNGVVRSDPRMPFGGIKRSGIGRELSYYGIKEFVNIKSVIVN